MKVKKKEDDRIRAAHKQTPSRLFAHQRHFEAVHKSDIRYQISFPRNVLLLKMLSVIGSGTQQGHGTHYPNYKLRQM